MAEDPNADDALPNAPDGAGHGASSPGSVSARPTNGARHTTIAATAAEAPALQRIVVAGPTDTIARWRAALASGLSPVRSTIEVTWVALAGDPSKAALRLRTLAHGHDALALALSPQVRPDRLGELCALVERPVLALAEAPSPAEAAQAFAAGASDYVAIGADPALALAVAGMRLAARRTTLASTERAMRDALSRAEGELATAREASLTDWLTGLSNRRHLEERLAEEENKALRGGQQLALVLCDLDRFKDVNDRFGHATGDRVLRAVADAMRAGLRNYDIPCRYGGEELALILPATSLERATQVAERLRLRLRALRFEQDGETFHVTASFGVAALPTPGVTSARELLESADRCMLLAKRDGRDRVLVFRPCLPGLEPPDALALARESESRVDALLRSVRGLTRDAARAHMHAVHGLVQLMQQDQGFAFGRADIVSDLASAIAQAMGLDEPSVTCIRRAGLFQDLGMVAVGPAIERRGSLTDAERAIVERHPAISVQIAEEIGFLEDELPLILHHHERLDGTGYPRGLAGARIPLGARVLSVAAAYEAMTSARPYRPARTPDEAFAELAQRAGTWYDPEVVDGARRALTASACGSERSSA